MYHFLFRGPVKFSVVDIVVAVSLISVSLITVLSVILIGYIIGGIVCVIVGPVLILKEQVSVPILDVEAPGVVARMTAHTVDNFL